MDTTHSMAPKMQDHTGLESGEGAELGGKSMAPANAPLFAGLPFQFQDDGADAPAPSPVNADTGNSALVSQITTLLAAPDLDATGVNGVLQTMETLSDDRLRVVVLQLRQGGQLDGLQTRLLPAAGDGFQSTTTRITTVITELADPLAGTVAAEAEDQTAVTGILNQGLTVDAQTGQVVPFVDIVEGRSYQDDVIETLTREVAEMYPRAVTRNAMPRHDWQPYEVIAQEAKDATDDLYGAYNVAGSPMTSSGPNPNLLDVRDQTYNDRDLAFFANYLVTGHNPWNPIYPDQKIHAVHNADLNRPEEAGILRQAILAWMADAANLDQLREIRRSWSGVQAGGNIFIQRWDHGNDTDNRRQFWSMFQTMIHEYLHKITHQNYSAAARRLGRHREQIFTEGGTSYFDKRVWLSIFPQEIAGNATLRQNIEGQAYPYDPAVIPDHHGYDQMNQFEQIVNQVGEENAKAAYFKGEVDKIAMPAA